MRGQLSTLGRSSRAMLLVAAGALSCGGSAAPAPSAPAAPVAHRRFERPTAPSGPRPTGGSSDGTTCEEARDQNVEEVAIGAASGPDLTVRELGAVLEDGKYLETCQVAQDVKVSVCAAVKNGQVLGVTIAMDPPDPELELCVAKEVRALQFPVNPKMDVVKTQF